MSTKVALVTASSAGLGAACVKALAATHRVVINYHSRPEKAQEVISQASEIHSTSTSTSSPSHPSSSSSSSSSADAGPRFHAIQADLSQKSEIERLVHETISTMGRLDVVVSNQGWTRLTNFHNLDEQVNEDDWDRCFTVNVKSHLWLLYAARPYLEASPGGGAFVTVASLAGVRPSGSSLPYAVTKAAQIHLVKGLATICGPKIRCNSVSPGLLMTEWGAKFPKEKVEAAKQRAAGKDVATVEDVAEMVRTMVEGRSMTGQNVVVDCGIAI